MLNAIISVLPVVLVIVWLAAYGYAITWLIEVIRAKGHTEKSGFLLWFVGLFTTPIVLGLYAIALPDKAIHTGAIELAADEEAEVAE